MSPPLHRVNTRIMYLSCYIMASGWYEKQLPRGATEGTQPGCQGGVYPGVPGMPTWTHTGHPARVHTWPTVGTSVHWGVEGRWGRACLSHSRPCDVLTGSCIRNQTSGFPRRFTGTKSRHETSTAHSHSTYLQKIHRTLEVSTVGCGWFR